MLVGQPYCYHNKIENEINWKVVADWNSDSNNARILIRLNEDMFNVNLDLFKFLEIYSNLNWMVLFENKKIAKKYLPKLWIKNGLPFNVWLGFQISNNEDLKNNFEYFSKLKAHRKFFYIYSLQEDLNLKKNYFYPKLKESSKLSISDQFNLIRFDWVILEGCKSQVHPDWVRNIQYFCRNFAIPFYFLGWGNWVPEKELDQSKIEGSALSNLKYENDGFPIMYNVGKNLSSKTIDGVMSRELPE